MANSLKSLHPFPLIDRTEDQKKKRTDSIPLFPTYLLTVVVVGLEQLLQQQTSMLYTIRACFFQSQGPLLPLFTKKNKIPCWIAFFFPENGNFSASGKTFLGYSSIYGNGNTYGKKVRRERWSLEKTTMLAAIVYYMGYTKQHTQDYSKSLTH